MIDRIRRALVWRWTRLKTRWLYEWEEAKACWCGSTQLQDSPDVMVCADCGTGVLRHRLTDTSYQRWYASGDYRRWVRGSAEVTLEQFLREYRRGAAAYKWMRQQGVAVNGTRVLDFGCGAGGGLAVAKVLGADVTGVDSDKRSRLVRDNLGIPIFHGVPVDTWDRIILSHVIEHVLDPVRLLNFLTSALSHKGVLYIETPAWKEKSEIKLPHIWYFTPQSFRNLMDRAGLKIIAMTDGIQAVVRRKDG